MNQRFWNLFSKDYVKNCLLWKHNPENPVIPPSGNSWKSNWTANPDFLELNGKLLLFYRGNGIMPDTDGRLHDRIAVAEVKRIEPGILDFSDLNNGEPVVDVGIAGEFDSDYVLDPAAVIFKNKVWLYYTAVGPGIDSVGLAVSENWINFKKIGKVFEGRSSDVIMHEDKIYLITQQFRGKSYELYLAVSEDGVNFKKVQELPVFSGENGQWDSFSIVTPRLSYEDGYFYMVYGGSAYLTDEPEYFGLARSKDLIEWERHPGNPIFGCGAKGEPDGGAIWFPAVIETQNAFIMLYEGSRGNYSWDLHSSICMAWIEK